MTVIADKKSRLSIRHRPRRIRQHPLLRRMARETLVTPTDLIYPLFVTATEPGPIPSLPGQERHTIDSLCREAEAAARLGIPAVLLFGIPSQKDEAGSSAYDPDGIVPRAFRRLKSELGSSVALIADVCMCEYTTHGHCGILEMESAARNETHVLNDETVELLARAAVVYAGAGADVIAPSDMMDGRIGAIRSALDENGYSEIPMLSYAAKYCSAFYGPFRDAAESAPRFGDRRGYQMDPANRREAIYEIELDIEEGADAIMVKPALAYLDVIREARDRFHLPLAAYNVSGEYAMLKAAVEKGWLDEDRTITEVLTAIKRAGADWILTYHAREYAERIFPKAISADT